MNDIKVKLIKKLCNINNEKLLIDINEYIMTQINRTILINHDLNYFKIGDEVEIINTGAIYTTYYEFFEHFNFKNKKFNDISKNEINLNWTVFGEPIEHDHRDAIVIPICSNEGHEILISSTGIQKIETK